jgi:hypothetical protein
MHRVFRLVVYLGLTSSATPAPPLRSTDVAPTPEAFAAPEIILVYGSLLPERRVIASFKDNHRLLLAINLPAPSLTSLAKRPAYQLALFWGSQWRATAESPQLLSTLRPGQADQHGTFYPAIGALPAVLIIDAAFGQPRRTGGLVAESGLAILRRHRVPVRVPKAEREGPHRRPPNER